MRIRREEKKYVEIVVTRLFRNTLSHINGIYNDNLECIRNRLTCMDYDEGIAYDHFTVSTIKRENR